MLLTEEEAKTKRCQETFGAGAEDWVTVPANRRCIGSACMAWRWKRWELDPVDRHRIRGTAGYCGKAGIPDE